MKKLLELYCDMQTESTRGESAFIKKCRLTISEYRKIQAAAATLARGGRARTISENVLRVFSAYGFGVFCDGIGWEIRKNKNTKRFIDGVLSVVYGDIKTEVL